MQASGDPDVVPSSAITESLTAGKRSEPSKRFHFSFKDQASPAFLECLMHLRGLTSPPPPPPPSSLLPRPGVPVRFGTKEDGKWIDSGGVWEAKIADAPEKVRCCDRSDVSG